MLLTWTHGVKAPAVFEENAFPDWAWGVFIGTEGMLLASYPRHMLWPEERFRDYRPPEPSIPSSPGHHQEWIDACKTGGSTSCNFSYSGAVTEAVLLGNIAYRVGKPLSWDAQAMEFADCFEANALLMREYRQGWTL